MHKAYYYPQMQRIEANYYYYSYPDLYIFLYYHHYFCFDLYIFIFSFFILLFLRITHSEQCVSDTNSFLGADVAWMIIFAG